MGLMATFTACAEPPSDREKKGQQFCQRRITISVYVRDLSRWKEILTAVVSSRDRTVSYGVRDLTALQRATDQAQQSAVTQAKQSADRLAGLAGTRVVGILEIQEGTITRAEPFLQSSAKANDGRIPEETTLLSAEITITFELASPASENLARSLPGKQTREPKRKQKPGR